MSGEAWTLLGVIVGGIVGSVGTWLISLSQTRRQERQARQAIYSQFLQVLDELPEILARSVSLNDEVMAEWDRLEADISKLSADAVPEDTDRGEDGDFLFQHYMQRLAELAKVSNRGPLPSHEREELHRVSLKSNQLLSQMWLIAPAEIVIAAASAFDAVRRSMESDDPETVRTRGEFVRMARRDIGRKRIIVPDELESPQGQEPTSTA